MGSSAASAPRDDRGARLRRADADRVRRRDHGARSEPRRHVRGLLRPRRRASRRSRSRSSPRTSGARPGTGSTRSSSTSPTDSERSAPDAVRALVEQSRPAAHELGCETGARRGRGSAPARQRLLASSSRSTSDTDSLLAVAKWLNEETVRTPLTAAGLGYPGCSRRPGDFSYANHAQARHGTSINGNGSGTVPLTALTPVTRYRAKRRGPLRLLGKIFLWLLVVLLVAVGRAGRAATGSSSTRCVVRGARALAGVIAAEEVLAVPVPEQPTVALVARLRPAHEGCRRERRSALRHDHAPPRRPGQEGHLDALVPARPGRRPSRAVADRAVPRPDQRGLHVLRPQGHARDGEGSSRASRSTTSSRSTSTASPRSWTSSAASTWTSTTATSTTTRAAGPTYATIDLHSGYQKLDGQTAPSTSSASGTPTPTSTALVRQQAVREGVQAAGRGRLVAYEAPRDRQRDHRERRGGRGRRTRRSTSTPSQLCEARLRAPDGELPAGAAPGRHGLQRALRDPEAAIDRLSTSSSTPT